MAMMYLTPEGYKKARRIFMAVPMNGRTDDAIREDIKANRKTAEQKAYDIFPNAPGFCFVDGLDNKRFVDLIDSMNIPVEDESTALFGISVVKMSTCDAIYFCPGWENAKGCLLERDIALAKGMPMIFG